MRVINRVIRQESPSDVAAIHAVTAAAFLNAPHTAHTEEFIVEALRKAGALTLSLVAEQCGDVVGHVALSAVSVSYGSTGWYGLGPISVKPELQGKGHRHSAHARRNSTHACASAVPRAAFLWGTR